MKAITTHRSSANTTTSLRSVHHIPTRVALHVTSGIILLWWKDILYCSADSNYTHVYAADGRHYMVSKTLREVQSKLPAVHFARIHQSHLVNLEAVGEVTSTEVKMIDEASLPLARAKRKQFHDLLERISIHIRSNTKCNKNDIQCNVSLTTPCLFCVCRLSW
jgi:two-component system LytT family response regulator